MTREFIHKTVKLLNQEMVKYVITGGVAKILMGEAKETFDFDLLIDCSKGNICAINNFIYKLTGSKIDVEQNVKNIEITRVKTFPFSIDILPKLDGLKNENVFSNAQRIDIEGYSTLIISQSDLNKNYNSFKN